MTASTRRSIQVAGWLAATLLLLFCLRETSSAQARSLLLLVRWRWIVVALIANAAILVSWAALWWAVAPRAERVRFAAMFEINAAASALMNTIPFLGGHAASVVLLMKRGPMSQPGALSVLALDQLGEGVAKVAVFGVVAAAAPIPNFLRAGIAVSCAVVGALLTALLVAAHGHRYLRVDPEDRRSRGSRMRAFVAEWAQRMDTLRSPRASALALVFAVGTKVMEGAGLVAVQQALGVQLSVGATSLVLASVILGSILPVAPGNVGTYEAGAFLAYRHLGVDPAQATLLALAAHLCFLVPAVGVGYLTSLRRLGPLIAGRSDAEQEAAEHRMSNT